MDRRSGVKKLKFRNYNIQKIKFNFLTKAESAVFHRKAVKNSPAFHYTKIQYPIRFSKHIQNDE
ncbi:hypothetical protein DLM77_09885 [Leptospira yasudae]|uniref:Uncharacterized protein n=1 Tax=Leptospira yasudae TaxID=2202201 RepID=A0ABX9M5E8_9LEPT|nr:hypothetical protein DLM77_09885 [Leptospira yasudae]